MLFENSDRSPRNPETGAPIPPRMQPGYYAGYSTLAQQSFWDAATRKTVLNRLGPPPAIRFFNREQADLLQCICIHLLPQDDREISRQIPIVPHIDDRLYEKRIPGFRFADMPPDGEAYKHGLAAIETMAQERFGQEFLKISWEEQEQILRSIHDGKLGAADKIWQKLPADRFWKLLMEDCVEIYYAHPWSWDEIGFGGPAYPRGYMRLERGEPEDWEVEEERYEWSSPPGVLSDPEAAQSNFIK